MPVNGFLTQPDSKSRKRSVRSIARLIPGWVQVALMAWMVSWGNHTLPIQSSYDPEHEYIAAGSGLDRLPKAAQSNSDGRAERARASQFLELGLTVNGTRYWKIYGPDLNGAYGGLNGTGGLDGIYNQSTATSTFLINDTYGHGELTYTGSTYTWNPSLSDGYGVLPGSAIPTAISSGTTNLASLIGWRGKTIDGTGFYYLGARYYAPDSGTFLSPDPLGHATSWDLYSYCNGDPVNRYDADGRVGKGGLDSAVGLVTGTAGLVYNGVGSVAYGVTSLGGLAPNPVSDIYADQWQGVKNTGSGLATLGSQAASLQFGTIGQELTGGANASTGYRIGYGAVGIASIFAGGELADVGNLGKAGEVADAAVTTAEESSEFTTLYHGTSSEAAASIRANGIDLSSSRANLDFGKGFYTTTDLEQAQSWAARQGGEVLTFNVPNSQLSQLSHLEFASADSAWTDFVAANRGGAPLHEFDAVSGPMLGNPRAFMNGANPTSFGQQMSFHSDAAVDLLNSSLVR